MINLKKVSNFTTIDTIYGKWIVSRSAVYHAESLIKTGVPIHLEDCQFLLKIIDTLPDNCIIVDAGSNAGIFSVPFATSVLDRGGKVYAFEVQKKLYQALCGTSVLNDLDSLEVFNFGLGSVNQQLKIPKVDYSESWDYGILSLVDQNKINNQQYDIIDIITLDSLELEGLDFIKIDIEGMEVEALIGATNTIKNYRPWAYIEYWNSDQLALKSYFDNMDYTIYRLDPANILCCPNERLLASKLKINSPLF
jgi:FkbM family methyltransferase